MKHYYYDFPEDRNKRRKPKKDYTVSLVIFLYVVIVSLSIYILIWK